MAIRFEPLSGGPLDRMVRLFLAVVTHSPVAPCCDAL